MTSSKPKSLNQSAMFRVRINESKRKMILQLMVIAELGMDAFKKSRLKRVTVDATVQEKAVSYSTDAKLLKRVRNCLARRAQFSNLTLHLSYVRAGRKQFLKMNRYAQVRQMEQMKGELKKLYTILCSEVRDGKTHVWRDCETLCLIVDSDDVASWNWNRQMRNDSGANQQEQGMQCACSGGGINQQVQRVQALRIHSPCGCCSD